MTLVQRLVLLAVAGSIPLAMSGLLGGPSSIGLALAAAFLATWLVPRFWRDVVLAAGGGVVAGLVVLGPGFRLVMRLVAIVDPVKTPEFTVEGTMFIVIGIGTFFGVSLAIVATLVCKALGLRRTWNRGLVLGTVVMGALLASSDLRSELFEFGAGPWMNIPLFAAVAYGYAAGAFGVVDRLERVAQSRAARRRVEVPA